MRHVLNYAAEENFDSRLTVAEQASQTGDGENVLPRLLGPSIVEVPRRP